MKNINIKFVEDLSLANLDHTVKYDNSDITSFFNELVINNNESKGDLVVLNCFIDSLINTNRINDCLEYVIDNVLKRDVWINSMNALVEIFNTSISNSSNFNENVAVMNNKLECDLYGMLSILNVKLYIKNNDFDDIDIDGELKDKYSRFCKQALFVQCAINSKLLSTTVIDGYTVVEAL